MYIRGALRLFSTVALAVASTTVAAQEPPRDPPQTADGSSRQAAIEREQAAKLAESQPYVPNKFEQIFGRIDGVLAGGMLRWHPFFQSAYAGGGFTLGAGHAKYVGAYNFVDVRGSYTISGYKRAEVEFVAPRLFNRRAQLSVVGGWREATQVGFYGLGTDTSIDDHTNYLFQQPYGSALFTLVPTRRALMLRGGVEFTQWSQEPGAGDFAVGGNTVLADGSPGTWRRGHLPSHTRDDRLRLANLARLFQTRRLLRRDPARLPRRGRCLRLSNPGVRGDSTRANPA